MNNIRLKKGQALVEFVIILPIFLILILGVIDIGNILYSKIIMEDEMSNIIVYYNKGESVDVIKNKLKNYNIEIDENNDYINFKLVKKIDIITPGLNFVFDNPYSLEIKRSIINE